MLDIMNHDMNNGKRIPRKRNTIQKYLKGKKLEENIEPGLDSWLHYDKWPDNIENNIEDSIEE
jgi:hypothetical protein